MSSSNADPTEVQDARRKKKLAKTGALVNARMTHRALLCLSLVEQRQSEIHDRLTTGGHLVSPEVVRRALDTLVANGLAVMEKTPQACLYRLAEGPAVDAALDAAWATA